MTIAIIGAMKEEIIQIQQLIDNIQTIQLWGLQFFLGTIGQKKVVLVKSGIGKVNASLCTTLLINHFQAKLVLFTGIAGAINPEIQINDIVIGEQCIQHDVDASAFWYPLGTIPRMKSSSFSCDPQLVYLAEKIAIEQFWEKKVRKGTILSGDQFIASKEKKQALRKTFQGQCAEMEGAALAQVCYLLNIPFLIIRSISDAANEEAKDSCLDYVNIAANTAKTIVEKILPLL